MEPVEIDILLNSNVAEEGAKATSAIEEMAQASLEAREETKMSLELQREYLQKLRNEYQEVQKQLSKMEFPTKEKQKLQSASNALARELAEEGQGLKQLEAEWAKMNKGYSDVQLRMRQTREQMKLLAAAGRENSTEYRQLSKELEELAKANALITRTQTEMAKGNQSFKGLTDAVSAFSGAASAAVGAWTLLGGSQEDQAKIQTKLQSLMAITIGLQKIQNVMLETSTFRLQTVTKAKALWSSANIKLATTLGISTVAAKALMATLTLGLSVAVGAVILAYDKWSSRQKKLREEQERFNSAVSSKVDTTIVKYEKLRQQFVALNGDVKMQEEFVRKNGKAFEDLGVKVSNAQEAENLFIDNKDAFIDSILSRAEAAAYMEIAAEKYREVVKLMMEAETKPKSHFGHEALAFFGNLGQAMSGQGWGANTAESVAEGFGGWIRTNKAAKANQLKEEIRDMITKGLLSEEEAKDLLKKSGIKLFGGGGDPVSGQGDTFRKAQERLAKLSGDIIKESTEIEIAAMREGRERKIGEINAEYDAKKYLIEKRLKELDELERQGVEVSGVRTKLTNLGERIDTQHANDLQAVNDTYDTILTDIETEVTNRTATAIKRRLSDLDNYYKEILAKSAQAANEEVEIERVRLKLKAQHDKEAELITREHELKVMDAEERIALRQAQMSGKQYALQVDREEELLQLQLEYSRKRLAKLEEIEAAGGDAGEAIDEARQEIEELKDALNKLPTKKLLEIANGLKSIFGQLSGLSGEVGQAFGELAKGVDNVMIAFKEGASTMDRVSGAIGGLMQLYNLAADTAEENRKAMEAWQEANENALQVARMQRIEAHEYKESNLFGVQNPYARAIAGARQYAQSIKEINDLARQLGQGNVQTGTKKVFSGKNMASGAAGGAAAGAAIGSIIPGIGSAIGAGIGALFGGIFGASKKKIVPVFNSLTKQYGQIFDKNTFELNPKILQDYNKLDSNTKKLVDNWDRIKSKAKEAQEEMRANFRDLAGDLGSKLSDALIQGLQNDDIDAALKDFETGLHQMIYSIMQQKVFAQYFQKYFDELTERMDASFGAGGDGDITDDLIWFANAYKGAVGGYVESMEQVAKELKQQGIELPEAISGRKAVARGVERVDQDSIDDLNGRMTVVVDRINILVTYHKATEAFERETKIFQTSLLRQVDRIAANSEFLRELSNIKSDIFRLYQEGIRIRR